MKKQMFVLDEKGNAKARDDYNMDCVQEQKDHCRKRINGAMAPEKQRGVAVITID